MKLKSALGAAMTDVSFPKYNSICSIIHTSVT